MKATLLARYFRIVDGYHRTNCVSACHGYWTVARGIVSWKVDGVVMVGDDKR